MVTKMVAVWSIVYDNEIIVYDVCLYSPLDCAQKLILKDIN